MITSALELKKRTTPMLKEMAPVSNSDPRANPYERDYYTWALEQGRALLERRV
jgi:hypothetical protein